MDERLGIFLQLDVLPITAVTIYALVGFAPALAYLTFIKSGHSKGLAKTALFVSFVLTVVMAFVCWANGMEEVVAGYFVIPVLFVGPIFAAVRFRKLVLQHEIKHFWLILSQMMRVAGLVYLIEWTRGRLPPEFALTIGLSNLFVVVVGALLILRYSRTGRVPGRVMDRFFLLCAVDSVLAMFFGYGTANTEFQFLNTEIPNNFILFPTGLIAMVLMPQGMFFMTLILLNRMAHDPENGSQDSERVDSETDEELPEDEDFDEFNEAETASHPPENRS